MRRKPVGSAWIVYKQDVKDEELVLISLLKSRKTRNDVSKFVEQLYVDEFATIEEKIEYKKDRKSWPYPAEKVDFSNAICCGFRPLYWAIRCYKINIDNGFLVGLYRFVKSLDSTGNPKEIKEQEIRISIAS